MIIWPNEWQREERGGQSRGGPLGSKRERGEEERPLMPEKFCPHATFTVTTLPLNSLSSLLQCPSALSLSSLPLGAANVLGGDLTKKVM